MQTQTLTDPRLALSLRRARLQNTIAMQRAALKVMCGCDRCGDGAARSELAGLIHRNLLELDDLTDAITDQPML
jgi:hypothetical protein